MAPEQSIPESREFWNLANIGINGLQNEGTGQTGLDRQVGRNMGKFSQESIDATIKAFRYSVMVYINANEKRF